MLNPAGVCCHHLGWLPIFGLVANVRVDGQCCGWWPWDETASGNPSDFDIPCSKFDIDFDP
jgi:hypothetical protein